MKRRVLRLSQPEMVRQRERVRQRDGYRCTGCGCLGPLQVHHKQRRSQGGGDELENLVSLCLACHKAAHPERLVRWKRPA
jgi:5-methylcytosine-specific restriction endonuclease McrA